MTFLPDSWLSPAEQTQLIGKDKASRLTMTLQPSPLEFVEEKKASKKKPQTVKNTILWSGETKIVLILMHRVLRTPGTAHLLEYTLPTGQPGPAASIILWGWESLMERRCTDGTPDPEHPGPQVNVLEWPGRHNPNQTSPGKWMLTTHMSIFLFCFVIHPSWQGQ